MACTTLTNPLKQHLPSSERHGAGCLLMGCIDLRGLCSLVGLASFSSTVKTDTGRHKQVLTSNLPWHSLGSSSIFYGWINTVTVANYLWSVHSVLYVLHWPVHELQLHPNMSSILITVFFQYLFAPLSRKLDAVSYLCKTLHGPGVVLKCSIYEMLHGCIDKYYNHHTGRRPSMAGRTLELWWEAICLLESLASCKYNGISVQDKH